MANAPPSKQQRVLRNETVCLSLDGPRRFGFGGKSKTAPTFSAQGNRRRTSTRRRPKERTERMDGGNEAQGRALDSTMTAAKRISPLFAFVTDKNRSKYGRKIDSTVHFSPSRKKIDRLRYRVNPKWNRYSEFVIDLRFRKQRVPSGADFIRSDSGIRPQIRWSYVTKVSVLIPLRISVINPTFLFKKSFLEALPSDRTMISMIANQRQERKLENRSEQNIFLFKKVNEK